MGALILRYSFEFSLSIFVLDIVHISNCIGNNLQLLQLLQLLTIITHRCGWLLSYLLRGFRTRLHAGLPHDELLQRNQLQRSVRDPELSIPEYAEWSE